MSETPTAQALHVAAETMRLLRTEHWTEAHWGFDPALATGLPVPELRSRWTAATDRLGSFLRAETLRLAVVDGYAVSEVTLFYSSGQVLCRVTVDEAGRVAGLFVAATGPTPVRPVLSAGHAVLGTLLR